MSLFPDQGLNTKMLLDRIGELWVDRGFGTRDQFLKIYSQCLDYLQWVVVPAFWQFWRNALRSMALTYVLLAIRRCR